MAQNNISSLDNRPWVPHHIPTEVRKELYRRTIEQGFNYVNTNTSWTNYKNYRGPLSSWVRVTSNGTGIVKNPLNDPNILAQKVREGFVLYGGQGFHDAFGNINFNKGTFQYKTNILGYDTSGEPHMLDTSVANPNIVLLKPKTKTDTARNVPLLLPPPGIVSVEATIQREIIRKVTINWKCYSFSQLEYMTPYFLTPGISMIVEFGWNLFDQSVLLNFSDPNNSKQELIKLWKDGTPFYNKSLQSNGMYDGTFGSIANYEIATQDGVTYDCKTEIFSKHRNYSGSPMKGVATVEPSENKTLLVKTTLSDFCEQRLKNVAKCLEGNGKNFFEPLTNDEKKSENQNLQKNFYKGKKENRIFIARGKLDNDPLKNIYLEPDSNDWDKSSPDDTWVTMGFVIELVNLFIGKKVGEKEETAFGLFELDIDDVILGAHPNLISADGSKVLIPNPIAPKYNLGAFFWKSDSPENEWGKNKLQSQTSYKTHASFEKLGTNMQPYNQKLYDVFKTGYGIDISAESKKFEEKIKSNYLESLLDNLGIKDANIEMSTAGMFNEASSLGAYRDDLDAIINRFRYNFFDTIAEKSAAFPQLVDYTPPTDKNSKTSTMEAKRWGYLKDLFVHVDVIREISKNAKTAKEFFDSLLKVVSDASGGYWELSVIEDAEKLKVVDKKMISSTLYNNLFQFDLSSDSCIKSLSFSGNPSSAQMAQVIAGSSNNQATSNGDVTPTAMMDFKFGDRLSINQLPSGSLVKKNMLNDSENIIKQFQKSGKVAGTYGMTLKNNDETKYYEYINLALPNVPLLIAILNDGDFTKNTNVYGGQQPNFTCELVLQGISGLRTFQCFSIKNLPKPYSPDEIMFQVTEVSHSIQNGDWTTTIKAGIRTLPKKITKTFSNGQDDFNK